MLLAILSFSLTLSPVAPATGGHVTTVTSVKLCEEDPDMPLVQLRRLVTDDFEVQSLEPCSPDRMSFLVIDKRGGYYAAGDIVSGYQGAIMTEAPLYISRVKDGLFLGRLADGSRAVVQRLDLKYENRCWQKDRPCHDYSLSFVQAVQVCRIPDDDSAPSCGTVKYSCAGKTCGAVTLKKGVLSVRTNDGPRSYTVVDAITAPKS